MLKPWYDIIMKIGVSAAHDNMANGILNRTNNEEVPQLLTP